jgi:hypothetical protein
VRTGSASGGGGLRRLEPVEAVFEDRVDNAGRSGRRRRRRAILRISKVSQGLATRLTGMLGGNLYELLPMGRGSQSYRLQASRDLAGSTARDFRISARMVRRGSRGCWGLLARGTSARQNRLMATVFREPFGRPDAYVVHLLQHGPVEISEAGRQDVRSKHGRLGDGRRKGGRPGARSG